MLEVLEGLVRATGTPARRSAGIALCRHLARQSLRPLYRALGQERTDGKAGALRVLTAVAGHSAAAARELLDHFDLSLAVRVHHAYTCRGGSALTASWT